MLNVEGERLRIDSKRPRTAGFSGLFSFAVWTSLRKTMDTNSVRHARYGVSLSNVDSVREHKARRSMAIFLEADVTDVRLN